MKCTHLFLTLFLIFCLSENSVGFFGTSSEKDKLKKESTIQKTKKKKYSKNTIKVDKELLPNWRKVQEGASDTVVQVFVQVASFNWQEPFKSPKQHRSYGTAFFIDHEGHLISNFHVDKNVFLFLIASMACHVFPSTYGFFYNILNKRDLTYKKETTDPTKYEKFQKVDLSHFN